MPYRVIFNLLAVDDDDVIADHFPTIEAAQAAICEYVEEATGADECTLKPVVSMNVGAVIFYDIPGAACAIVREV